VIVETHSLRFSTISSKKTYEVRRKKMARLWRISQLCVLCVKDKTANKVQPSAKYTAISLGYITEGSIDEKKKMQMDTDFVCLESPTK